MKNDFLAIDRQLFWMDGLLWDDVMKGKPMDDSEGSRCAKGKEKHAKNVN